MKRDEGWNGDIIPHLLILWGCMLFVYGLIMMGASTARRDVDMSTKELAKFVLSEVHTAELSGSERGRHILYVHSSQIHIDPTDPLGKCVESRIRSSWVQVRPCKWWNPVIMKKVKARASKGKRK